MKTIRIALVCCFLLCASSVMGQTVLYWHPSNGSNQDIDDMVDDMESGGATVTSTTVEEDFYKELVNGPWDLVVVADQIVDTQNPDYGSYIASGGEIFVLTSQQNDDVLVELLSALRAMTAVTKDIPGTVACFIQFIDCRAACIISHPTPFSQGRINCDAACNTALVNCLNS